MPPVGTATSRAAFSLIELVIVVTIIGVLAAIGVPRMSGAADKARLAALDRNLTVARRCIDLYEIDHGGMGPHLYKAVLDTDGDKYIARLVKTTDTVGEESGPYGPYLLQFPQNPFNQLATVRIDGTKSGANTHGWHVDSSVSLFTADSVGHSTR